MASGAAFPRRASRLDEDLPADDVQPAGYNVPVGEIARVEQVDAPAQISREDSLRRLLVECNVRGRDIGCFVAEAKEKLAGIERRLPTGYRLVWGGQFENQQRAMRRLMIVVPVALLLIFVLLVSRWARSRAPRW